MAKHPASRVQDVAAIVAAHMEDIESLFLPGSKITVLVRRPEKPDGSQDFILTNDTIEDAIGALQLRQRAPTLTGDI
jgi:hypothetical protein